MAGMYTLTSGCMHVSSQYACRYAPMYLHIQVRQAHSDRRAFPSGVLSFTGIYCSK